MNRKAVRICLIQKEIQLKHLAQQAGIDYDRLQKILNGYRVAKPHEIEAIALALDLPASAVAG
jgi:DNA-binding Xre family transcriptional regulator